MLLKTSYLFAAFNLPFESFIIFHFQIDLVSVWVLSWTCFLILSKTGRLENLAVLRICCFMTLIVCPKIIYIDFPMMPNFFWDFALRQNYNLLLLNPKKNKIYSFREKLTRETLSMPILKGIGGSNPQNMNIFYFDICYTADPLKADTSRDKQKFPS